jgi:hypothetical protein
MALPTLDATTESTLSTLWEDTASGRIGLHDLHAVSPSLFGLWTHGHDTASRSMSAALRQARHDTDRAWLFALNEPDKAAELGRRLDRALAACPPHIVPHSPDYWAWAFRGVLSGSAA